jgi:hypothetical protein
VISIIPSLTSNEHVENTAPQSGYQHRCGICQD